MKRAGDGGLPNRSGGYQDMDGNTGVRGRQHKDTRGGGGSEGDGEREGSWEERVNELK